MRFFAVARPRGHPGGYVLKFTSTKCCPLQSAVTGIAQEYDRQKRGKSTGIAEAVFEK
jgi:hypothetical protein